MGIRMTGMISGMDTESIIKQMVDAQKLKNKRTTDKRDLLTFKQDKWKDLNTKLLKLYEESLGKMRLQSSYSSKKVTSSNEDKVTVTANGTSSPEGTHTVEVDQMANAQYLTGTSLKGKVSLADGKPLTGDSRLVKDLGMSATGIIRVTTKDGMKEIEIDEGTTLKSLASQLRDAGISANYDESQQRFFLGSKTGGADSYFTINGFDDPSIADRRNINDAVGYSGLSAENKAKVDNAYKALRGNDPTAKADAMNLLNDFAKDKVAATAKNAAINDTLKEVKDAIKNGGTYAGKDYAGEHTAIEDLVKDEMQKGYNDPNLDFTDPKYKDELDKIVENRVAQLATKDVIGTATEPISADMQAVIDQKQADIIANGKGTEIKSEADILAGLAVNMNNYAAGSAVSDPTQLTFAGLSEATTVDNGDGTYTTTVTDPNVTLQQAQSSIIRYNGVEVKGDSNVVNVNGLTITIKGVTQPGEKISLNVVNNAQETYDMIKGFVKSYNSILAEMNSLYYAPSSKGYDPLSEEERGAMSDKQVEMWEGKITDSILRRDDTVGSILSTMKTAANTGVTVNGKRYSLASFGIQTSTDYTEKGLLHISGDKEDGTYGSIDDKLMKAINEDPDTVMQVFTQISQSMFNEIGEKCKGITNERSARTFYKDKQMETQQLAYKKQISILEKKLTQTEDKYYKQFAAMESALAKLQSQTNALAGMMGG